jgi:molybdenum cofactor cytidylyltransferase
MNRASLPGLHILILAAGFSSRLGRPKALARVGSRTLLHRTLAAAAGVRASKVTVVVPRSFERYKLEAHGVNALWLPNPRRAHGLSSSVRRGIAHARYAPAVLLLPVDLAALQTRELCRLVSRWHSVPRRVIASRIHEHGKAARAALPLILPHRLFAQARALTGDVGLRDLINALPPHQRLLVDVPSAAFDIDTPQDLQNARRRLRFAAGSGLPVRVVAKRF